jgi:hypothetical protein
MKDEYTILQKIKIRLGQYHTDNNSIVFDDAECDVYLNELLSDAKESVINVRHYPTAWTEEQIESDLKKYEKVLIKLVIYDFNKEGMEFENSHTESGVSRQFQSRARIMADVLPFVDMFA